MVKSVPSTNMPSLTPCSCGIYILIIIALDIATCLFHNNVRNNFCKSVTKKKMVLHIETS